MSLTKLGLIGLFAGVLILGGVLFSQDRSPLSAGTSHAPETPYRRGDDPTYAEELKK